MDPGVCMNDAPLVSIGMPVHNGAKTIRYAVTSIQNQFWSNWELIIIDDGSTDATLSILKSFSDSRVRIFSDGKKQGIAARLNQAVQLARGKYFARMDADDFSFPHRLERQVDFLQHRPEVDLVGSSLLVFKNEKELVGVRRVPASHGRICSTPDQGFKLMHPTWMGRLAWFRIHPYNETALLCEDQELLLRHYQTSCYANIDEPLLGYKEDGLNLKKLLKTRWSWARQLVHFWYGTKRQPLYAARAFTKQALKAAIDTFAIITGLKYFVLSHRATPIGDEHAPAVSVLQAGITGMKKKICLVTTVHFVIRWFLRPHIVRLATEYDITIVTHCSNQEFADLNLPQDVRFKKIPFVRKPHPVYDLLCFCRLYWFFKKNQFDLVHSIMPKTGLLAMTTARLAKVPVRIHTFTGQVWATRTGIRRQVLKMTDRLFASQTTIVLTDSHSQQDFLLNEKVIDPARSHVLLNGSICGVNPYRFCPDPVVRRQVRKQWLIPQKDVVFLFMGRLKRDKGLLELGEAFSDLILTRKGIHLMIVGTDEESIQEHPLFKQMTNVYFPGYTNTPEKFMNAADIFCLPSYREGFGSVILEAACVGIPSVASRIYGITDAVVDGKTGVLHAPGNVRELGGCMKKLLENPDLRKTMGDAARSRAISDFSEQQVTKALTDIYRKQINSQGQQNFCL
jgi:glycosyltransferase involved in cell wall biosynthesis